MPVLSVKAGNSRVVLIAFGINDRIRLTTYRTQDHLRALERACGLHGLLLETCSFRTLADEFAAFGRIDSFGRADDEVSVLGFIVWNVAIAHDELLSGVLRGIGRYGKPIAFLDETGALRRDPLPADIRGVHTWEMATGPASGEATGRFLHNIGHRSVAMLCSGNGLYARERGEGVRRAFRKAGFPDAVRVIGPLPGDPAAGPFPVNVAIDTPGAFVAPASIFIDEQRLLLEHAVRRELARPRYDPLFERALAVPGVSAWVAENDLFAIDALAFLKKRGVRVPQEINVVGFDDSLEASFFHLSSYHFNGEAVINRMLDHVCKPPKSRSPLHSMEIEGFVRERATTCAFRPGR